MIPSVFDDLAVQIVFNFVHKLYGFVKNAQVIDVTNVLMCKRDFSL